MKISRRDCLIFLIPTAIYSVILFGGKDEKIIRTAYPKQVVAVCAKAMAIALLNKAGEVKSYDLPIEDIESVASEYQFCFK